MDIAATRRGAKHALFYAVVFLVSGVLVELISAYAYWVRRGPDSPVLASAFVVQKAVEHYRSWRGTAAVGASKSSVPSPLFVPDDLLGYTIKPGVYTVTVTYQDRRLVFTATINADSTRATSRAPSAYKGRPVLIFGDSEAWGWVNDDFTSFPWILQTLRPEYRIVNYAQNGYGNLHELLQMEAHRGVVESAALVIVLFGDYLDNRNIPSPSRLWEFTTYYDSSSEGNFRRMTHPTAEIGSDGELHFGHVPLLCTDANVWCKRREPPEAEVHQVTVKILERMRRVRPGPMLVAYNSGADSSDVVRAAQRLGIGICDIRPNPDLNEQDNLEPFDTHPGPLTMSKYAEKLAACIPQALGAARAAGSR